jgi:cytochrome c556
VFMSTRSVCAIALGAALLLGGAGEVAAQGRGGGGGAPMTPTAYRQGIMQHFQANMGALNAVRQAQVGSSEHMYHRAVVIQQLAMMLSHAFPPNSIQEGSRALPAIWSNPSDFAARVNDIQAAAHALVDAARGGNAEQVATAQMAVQATCGACHTAFRGPAPGN